MKREKTTSAISKDCITDSLLILMRKKPFSDITIGEITDKAGVNRSTYYRNFNAKEDIIKYSFFKIFYEFANKNAVKNISDTEKVTKLFNHFLAYKKELMLIYKNGLSHYILDGLNEQIVSINGQKSLEDQYQAYWNIGGMYNSFLFWFSKDMDIPIEKLTALFLANIRRKS